MTIDQTVLTIGIAFLAACAVAVMIAYLQFQSVRRLPYYLLRKERTRRGWRLVLIALSTALVGALILSFGRQAAYMIVPPTPSITPNPTITQTPTVTLTPTVTDTPLATNTPTATATSTQTPTPQLPAEIKILIRETQPPLPDAVFSPVLVARRLDNQNQAINPQEDFEQPVGRLYGAFTYNNLQDGVRWTAVWRLGNEVVCIETLPWDGGTGGYGYTECALDNWVPAEYEIQIFYGDEWMISTRFEILGDASTSTPAPGS
ncbi:MAG: hypothetical protein PVI81_00815 [Anaerolineales bacterium]|jgi:hypothetical protein